MDTAREVRSLVEDKPELEPAFRAVLAADEPFTFDELDLDSGTFGEIAASAAIIKTEDGAYRIANRQAVRQALDGDFDAEAETEQSFSFPSIDRQLTAMLGSAILLVVALRLVSWPSVFRDGVVVLSGNDPYLYRYWVEQLVNSPSISVGRLPEGVANGEPLLIVALWLIAEMFGGTATAVGQVMGWYPVVSAALTAIMLYLLAVEVSDDRRVGIAAVVLLAVLPGHAMRTSLGFADHHAFDYIWLALVTLSIAVLIGSVRRSNRTAVGICGLTLGVAGQTLAWDASPLLLAPAGLTLAVLSVMAVYQRQSPVRRTAPVLLGVAGGSIIVWIVHTILGWHTSVVTAAPLIVLGGGITVTIIGEIAHRTGYSALPVLIAEVCTGSAGVGLVSVLFPDYWRLVVRSVTVRLVREGAIVETQNLFGPSFGWLLLFGLVLVLSVPYLGWASWKTMDDPRWAVPVVYGWYLLGLATLQIRFVGEFAIFSALFAGLGFVHLAERIDVSRPPVPFDSETDGRSFVFPGRRQLVALILLFLLIGGLGIVQVPIKVNQLTVTDTQYRTAAWMDGYSDGENWEYPQDYVFSQWSRNRVYNYFVNGESRSYTFAQDNYERFLLSDDPERWYERLRNRAGFIVFAGEAAPSGSVGAQLAAFGSRTEDTSGLAHYRAIHVSGENRVFRLVPGATISGGGAPNSTVTVTTTVRLDDRSVTYEREVKTTADGRYRVTVPYPGEYTANGETVQVSERAVEMGENVTV